MREWPGVAALVVKHMTFIECFPGETDLVLLDAAKESYRSAIPGPFPIMAFGRLIEWKARLFREVLVTAPGYHRLLQEDSIFISFKKNPQRASVQIGSPQGISFETPPSSGAETMARIVDRGVQSTISPFIYEEKA